MAQVFSREAVLVVRLVVLGVVAGSIVAGLAVARLTDGQVPKEDTVAQPIPFSHKHHVGDDGIDCRYCHTGVETGASAGLPGTPICLTCHSQLFADQTVTAPLRESAALNRPISWNRVHDLPDYVFFDHSVHVGKGVPCAECHGRVDQMPRIRRVASLKMQWCLACHRNPGPHLRSGESVFAPDPGPPLPVAQRPVLESRERLLDCSTCHR